ncbi:hypothetical protein [Micromonospora haikouensis]|uniref:Heparin binding hemagglutinin HbhA n=1 Tax=Micromonospora haikouensis TaxID=686309 RepID=A0A1C4YC62_9ACTN|nr:hypothetical protein [Micromonospora haikouensis]SCF18352.1 hypothetical protein GA0070558_14035 [Micromonospora haikouensis]
MTQPKTHRIPAPLYAAAGAGDLALEQLRKLPTVVTDLSGKVAADLGGKAVVTGFELRQKATETLRTANQTAAELRGRSVPAELNRLREAADVNRLREVADLNRLREAADVNRLRELTDLDRLRGLAARNAAVVVAGAQAAQERALAAYAELVARGERVVGAGVLEAADTVNADIAATEAELNPAPAAPAAPAPAAKADVPAPAAKADVPTPADVAEVVEAKPAAARTPRTRATKATTAKATAKTAAKGGPKAKAADSPAPEAADTPSAKLPKATRRTRPAAE